MENKKEISKKLAIECQKNPQTPRIFSDEELQEFFYSILNQKERQPDQQAIKKNNYLSNTIKNISADRLNQINYAKGI